MNPGDLRHRIVLQQEIFNKDSATGEEIGSWESVAVVWASVEPLRGREYFQALETHSEAVTRIRIRYRPGITNEMRVKYGERFLYIQSVIDVNSRHQELQLMCVENTPVGLGE